MGQGPLTEEELHNEAIGNFSEPYSTEPNVDHLAGLPHGHVHMHGYKGSLKLDVLIVNGTGCPAVAEFLNTRFNLNDTPSMFACTYSSNATTNPTRILLPTPYREDRYCCDRIMLLRGGMH